MDLLGVVHLAVDAGTVSRRAGVVRKIGVVPQIAGRAHGRFDAHVREIARHDQPADAAPPQIELQAGPREPAVHILDHDGTGHARPRLQPRGIDLPLSSDGLSGDAFWRMESEGENAGQLRQTPCGEKIRDALFGMRIVAMTA